MHPCHHAKTNPDTPAYIMAPSGKTVTFRELAERSNQIASSLKILLAISRFAGRLSARVCTSSAGPLG